MRMRSLVALVALALGALGLTGCLAERTYTYRIATRGPVTADVGQFAAHVDATLADPRGWSLGGAIRFVRTDGDADLTIWLATADTLPSFGAPCSREWSCRSGPDVIINHDRWTGATAAWPYGLDAYQHYVVNHEVGHWLGYGHTFCPGRGERAPVMVQQSKGGSILGPCRFNVWPLDSELDGVASRHGVGRRSTGLPSPDDPFGHLDGAAVTRDGLGRSVSARLTGWAIDGDTSAPLRVLVVGGGRVLADVPADRQRDDLAAAFPLQGGAHGFEVDVAVAPDTPVVCAVAVGTGGGSPLQQLDCAVVK